MEANIIRKNGGIERLKQELQSIDITLRFANILSVKISSKAKLVPVLSRVDNETLICPDCGTREALESLGIGAEERDSIIEAIHRCGRH